LSIPPPTTTHDNNEGSRDPLRAGLVAISTALEKALAGVAEATAQVQEALPDAHVHLQQDVRSNDEWAERYG